MQRTFGPGIVTSGVQCLGLGNRLITQIIDPTALMAPLRSRMRATAAETACAQDSSPVFIASANSQALRCQSGRSVMIIPHYKNLRHKHTARLLHAARLLQIRIHFELMHNRTMTRGQECL